MTGIIKTDQLQGAQGTTVTVPTGHTLAVTSNATVGGTLGVTGNSTVGGTLGVTGNATMGGTAAITGNTTVGGTFGVTGVHTIGTNAIYTSDGGAVTKNLVQSLVKAWLRFQGTSTAVIKDSHNVVSLTDSGTGNYTYGFISNMSSINYSATANGQDTTRRDGVHTSLEGQATTGVQILHFENNGLTDIVRVLSLAAGDLA